MHQPATASSLFSTFDSGNLLDGELGRAYRRAILVPGGSRPAKALVETYLGRSSSADAWERWMNGVEP